MGKIERRGGVGRKKPGRTTMVDGRQQEKKWGGATKSSKKTCGNVHPKRRGKLRAAQKTSPGVTGGERGKVDYLRVKREGGNIKHQRNEAVKFGQRVNRKKDNWEKGGLRKEKNKVRHTEDGEEG